MAVVLSKLYGINPELESRLKTLGIKDSDDLLEFCTSRNGTAVEDLAHTAGTEKGVITRLIHRADLARIRGIGETYTMLLEEAGVSTLTDLAKRNPETLRVQFTNINSERKLVGRVPALAMVNGWVTKARRLPATMVE